jgi:FkbM family methyltransferase
MYTHQVEDAASPYPAARDRTGKIINWVRLGQYRWLHKVVAALRIHSAAELMLRIHPLQRKLKTSHLTYRLTSLDQLVIAFEVFVQQSYLPALQTQPVETFIDLGCNAGWFALWLTSQSPTTPPRFGLLIDAHPRMVSEATWHLKKNGLANYSVVHGAVGLPREQSSTTFHLYPSGSQSTVLDYQAGRQFPLKGKIVEVLVPAISVASEWESHFGPIAVDLVKIDIEGKELDLVAYEGTFFRERVKRVVCEWHKWAVSLTQLDSEFEEAGFTRLGVYDESPFAGIAIYTNRKLGGMSDVTYVS